jgi:predicted nucleotidyltransferase
VINKTKSTAFGLPPKAMHAIGQIFAEYAAIEKVTLYGSRAMGNFREGSDIDLCIEGKEFSYTLQLRLENRLDDLLLPWKIDITVKHRIDNQDLLAHIQKHGMVIYQSRV